MEHDGRQRRRRRRRRGKAEPGFCLPTFFSISGMSYKKGTNMEKPQLLFTPYAWAKMRWFEQAGETEVSGFGVASQENGLEVHDFQTVSQKVGPAYCKLDDRDLAAYMDRMCDKGLEPKDFMMVWLHTHPGFNTAPSSLDNDTFQRVFGDCNWAVMCIMSQDGSATATIQFDTPFGRWQDEIEAVVDYTLDFPASDIESWIEEYDRNIIKEKMLTQPLAFYRQYMPSFGEIKSKKGGKEVITFE